MGLQHFHNGDYISPKKESNVVEFPSLGASLTTPQPTSKVMWYDANVVILGDESEVSLYDSIRGFVNYVNDAEALEETIKAAIIKKFPNANFTFISIESYQNVSSAFGY